MTNKDLTWIAAIIDRSGSMAQIKTDTEGGWSTFIAEQRKQPGQCLVTLVEFDHDSSIVYALVPVAEVPDYRLVPRGSTALYDAIGRTVTTLGVRLAALPEDQRPGSVLIPILTDGQENTSVEFNAEQIRQLIQQQQDVYNWVFQFMGANQDAVLAAGQIGIRASHAVTYTGENVAEVFAATSENFSGLRGVMRSGGSAADAVAASAYTPAQRAGAVSNKPSKGKDKTASGS